jgi:hypothetical protein
MVVLQCLQKYAGETAAHFFVRVALQLVGSLVVIASTAHTAARWVGFGWPAASAEGGLTLPVC